MTTSDGTILKGSNTTSPKGLGGTAPQGGQGSGRGEVEGGGGGGGWGGCSFRDLIAGARSVEDDDCVELEDVCGHTV